MKTGKFSYKNKWRIGIYSQGKGNPLYFKEKLVAWLNPYGNILGDAMFNSTTGRFHLKPKELLAKLGKEMK